MTKGEKRRLKAKRKAEKDRLEPRRKERHLMRTLEKRIRWREQEELIAT